LFVGGDFTQVSGLNQQYLAVFPGSPQFVPSSLKLSPTFSATIRTGTASQITVQGSTNLEDWTNLMVIENLGLEQEWSEAQNGGLPFRFYRLLGQ
jgi:hypothetical protein